MAVDLSGINPAYPVEGVPTTASVRANFAAVKSVLEQLDDAKFDRAGGVIEGDLELKKPSAIIFAELSGNQRLAIKNRLENQGSALTVVPNGTSTIAQTNAHSSSDWQNSTFSRSGVVGTEVFHTGNSNGTGAPCSAYRWGPSPTVSWAMDAAGVVTGVGGQIKFGNYVSAPALVADAPGAVGDAEISCRNSLGRVLLLQNTANSKGVACNGPAGEWEGWLVYRPLGTDAAYLGVRTPSAAAEGEVADAAFVRAVHASDARIKSELEEVGPTLEKLRSITAYTYKQQGYAARKLGSIAQDWQKHWPEATPEVTYNGEPRLGIDPLAAVAILLVAVQELAAEVKELRTTMTPGEA